MRKRFFVYELRRPRARGAHQPAHRRGRDELWDYSEGCLSVPGVCWDIVRPKQIHVVGLDLDGNEVSIEADELAARMFQHELDHLDGVLLTEQLDEDQRRDARRVVRELMMAAHRRRPAVRRPRSSP